MNPIFSEAVRRVLRRRRNAQQIKLDPKATSEAHSPSAADQPKSDLFELGRLRLFWFGLGGAVMTVLCASTSISVTLLSVTGLSGLSDYLNYGLFTVVFIFISIAVYAWWRHHVLSS